MKALLTGSSKGSSTLEILIAFAVLVLSITAVCMAAFGTQDVAIATQLANTALVEAQASLGQAEALSRFDFNLVNATTTVATVGGVTSTTTLAVSQLGPFIKQATSTVSWNNMGRALSISLSTLLTNPEGVQESDSCSSVLAGNWKSPQYRAYDMGQLGINGNDGSGFGISNLHAFNEKLYLTMSATPSSDKNTFFILNTSADPTQPPVYEGSVDNDASSTSGIAAVAVASSTSKVYAYLASESSFSKGQLQVVDVTNPQTPQMVKTFKIPVSAAPAAGLGSSIFYKDGYVYLGLAKITGGGDEFNIIDVGGGGPPASPANPVWKGGYNVGNGINEIFVRNNYAYIASPNNENLTILDVSDKTNPQRAGGYTPPALPESNGVGSNHGESVYGLGNTVYLGRTEGTTEFYALDDSTSTDPLSVIGSQDVGTSTQTTIYGLVVRDYLAFFLTKSQFQVWNISNPSAMQPWTPDGTTATFLPLSALGGTGTALDCDGNTLYAAIGSSQGTGDLLAVIFPS